MNVHGLQSPRGRINRLVNNKIKGDQIPGKDQRGKHENRINRLSEEQKKNVRDHIQMIPKYQSHYSRADKLQRAYLNCHMTIAEWYKEFYIPWRKKQSFDAVKKCSYRKILCTEFNIGFKLPKVTCKTCDECKD